MKYAHIEENTNRLMGWYDDKIHKDIPTPNIEVSEEVWQEAININANCYEDGVFIVKDFRTEEEIAEQELKQLKVEGEIYTLNNVDYQVPFMKDDADGLVQVTLGFMKGAFTSTVIHFSNGTKMPITLDEFDAFALWFADKRNSFFVGE